MSPEEILQQLAALQQVAIKVSQTLTDSRVRVVKLEGEVATLTIQLDMFKQQLQEAQQELAVRDALLAKFNL